VGGVIPISPAITGGDVDHFTLTPDGSTILFVGGVDDGVSGDHLYKVPVTGGTAIMLDDPSLHGDLDSPAVTDGTYAYFVGDQGIDNDHNEWFKVPIVGGPQTQITNNSGVEGMKGVEGDGFLIDGGSTLVFLDNTPDVLHTVPTDGSMTVTRIMPANIDVDLTQWVVTSDGSTAIYGSQPSGGTPVDFGAIATDGSTADSPSAIAVTGTLPAYFEIVDVDITPDDNTLIFTANYDFDDAQSLLKVAASGGPGQPLVSLASDSQDIDIFAVSPDGQKVAFVGDLDVDDVDHLYVVNIDGTGLTNLTPEIDGFTDVANGHGDVAWSPDGETLYYSADSETNGVFVLHSVETTPVPEPGCLVMLITAALGIASLSRRRG
jgi:hypothetical protein